MQPQLNQDQVSKPHILDTQDSNREPTDYKSVDEVISSRIM